MSFDKAAVERAVARHGRVARVVIAGVAGSTPRETGASMLVWDGGQEGSIGGGTLEFDAARHAFDRQGATRHALGPNLGQCCGGAVTLWTEVFDVDTVKAIEDGPLYARGTGEMPLAVRRRIDRARARGDTGQTECLQGWLVEPMAHRTAPLWIWGAGHVGRALVSVLSPLPALELTWIDTAPDRFPDDVPDGITCLPAASPETAVRFAPEDAMHLVLTYSHEIDFRLCDALLHRGFGFAGLIGSDTKWARFRKRLQSLGHSDAQIARICCPIGQKSLGKAPQAIAIGVAAQIVQQVNKRDGERWEMCFSASRA